jgi:cytosine/adenosine deaminase-related metal-dependent hydrolase
MTTLLNADVVLPDGVVKGPLHLQGGQVAERAAGDHQIDLRDHLIFPGLVNAHDHLRLNSLPPPPRRPPFPNSYAWAAAVGPATVAAARAVPEAARLWQGGLKNLLAGATTVADHDPWHPALDDPDFPVTVLRRSGWCHSLGLAPVAGIAGLVQRLRRRSFGPGVVESFAATPPDQPWIIHLGEGTDAVARAELGQLERLGCLAANTVLVHALALGAAERAEVIARGAAVVWCPGSNLSLFGETLDPGELAAAGRLALGTDSRLSGSRDLLDELRVAAQHSELGPRGILCLATEGGRRVLGMPEVGGLAPGQRADLIVVRYTGGDPYQILLQLQRRDLRAVVRNGIPALADVDLGDWFTLAA